MKQLLTILSFMAVFSACERKEKEVTADEFVTKTDTVPLMCVELTIDTTALMMSGRAKPPKNPKGPKGPKTPTPVPPIDTVINPVPVPPTPTDPNNVAMVLLDMDGFSASNLPYVWQGYNIPDLAPYVGPFEGILSQVRKLYTGYYITFTTDEEFYNINSTLGKRVRCIITPTGDWYPAGSGVAYTGSMLWGTSMEEAPCFVFSNKLGNNEEYIGDIVAHEVGHTIGLSHQKDFTVDCAVTATYSASKIMGYPFNTSFPMWFNQTFCTPQNDTLILRTNLQ